MRPVLLDIQIIKIHYKRENYRPIFFINIDAIITKTINTLNPAAYKRYNCYEMNYAPSP